MANATPIEGSCVVCDAPFTTYRAKRIYCSRACKQIALYYRHRKEADSTRSRRGGGFRREFCHLGHPIETRFPGGTPKRKCWTCNSARIRQNYRPGSNLRERLRIYGLTPEQYDALLQQQDGVCAICREKCRTGQRLSVDHDHATGRIRGLLCRNCNLGIGHLGDSADRIASALAYLTLDD